MQATDPVSGLHWGESRTDSIDGVAPGSDHVHISVVLAGSGRFFRSDALGPREDVYRPGRVNLILPDAGGGAVRCDGVYLGVIGIRLDKLRSLTSEYLDGRACNLERLAYRLWDAPAISAVIGQLGHAARTGRLNAEALEHCAGVVSLALALHDQGRVNHIEKDRGRLTAAQLGRVEAHVAQHLGRAVKVEELSGLLGLGVRHFTRVFKNSSGMSPYAYVMEQRLLRARALLGSGAGSSVTEVAMTCGFSSHAAFSAAFRARFGVTPSRERRLAVC